MIRIVNVALVERRMFGDMAALERLVISHPADLQGILSGSLSIRQH
jgi:hypothetical protein